MLPRSVARALAALALLVVCTGPLAGQDARPATVVGVVRDGSGLAVAGAEIEVRAASGRAWSTVTDHRGRFRLTGIQPGGPYTLLARRMGLGEARLTGLTLDPGAVHRHNLVLPELPLDLPGVRAVATPDSVFNRARTGAGTVIPGTTLAATPLVNRDVTGLAALSPMVAIQEGAISVAGQNSRFNTLSMDGVPAQDVFGLSPSGVPGGHAGAKPLPMDAVQRYTVLVAPFDVRRSGFTGGMLDATTRSGGAVWSAGALAQLRGGGLTGGLEDPADLLDSGRSVEGSSVALGGFSAGGPVGGARLFVAAEVERRRRPAPGIHLGEAPGHRVGLHADTVARLADVLGGTYGLEAGRAGGYRLGTELGNLFARLDAPLGSGGLTVRYNMISARDEVPAERFGFAAYELGSAGARLESRAHSALARLRSRWGVVNNELTVHVQRGSDHRRAASRAPQVEVRLTSDLEGGPRTRTVRVGGDPLAHVNDLSQTVLSLSNDLAVRRGEHTLTAGVALDRYAVRRTYLPNVSGTWRFNSLEDLRRNEPWSFERLIPAEGYSTEVETAMLRLSGYLQDEWTVRESLSLRLGVRVDAPWFQGAPTANPWLAAAGIATDRMPSARPLLSPRLGFNWRPPLERRTQVRGGVGVFTGTPPLAWIADAFARTGLQGQVVHCQDAYSAAGDRLRSAPGLSTATPPASCIAGGGGAPPDVVFLSPDLRAPRNARASLAVDHQLPGGLVATVEGVYTRALNQVALRDINLSGPLDRAEGHPTGVGIRELFGEPRLVPGIYGPLEPERRFQRFGRVLRVENASGDAALAAAAEVRWSGQRADARLAYTYTRSVDVRSLLYPDAAMNYGLTPVRGDPGEPGPRHSAFDRPHRVLASGWVRLAEWADGLTGGVTYIGQSGLPYSYVYASDINGDGYPGPGAGAEAYNDLYYVARHFSEIPASLASAALLEQLAAVEPCLRGRGGSIPPRNTCRAPWSNRLDVRLSQSVPLAGADVRVQADVMNVLNLVNGDWGRVHVVPPVVPLVQVDQRVGCPGMGCGMDNPLSGQYVGARRLDAATGAVVPERPYLPALPDSYWRAQLGVRVSF